MNLVWEKINKNLFNLKKQNNKKSSFHSLNNKLILINNYLIIPNKKFKKIIMNRTWERKNQNLYNQQQKSIQKIPLSKSNYWSLKIQKKNKIIIIIKMNDIKWKK